MRPAARPAAAARRLVLGAGVFAWLPAAVLLLEGIAAPRERALAAALALALLLLPLVLDALRRRMPAGRMRELLLGACLLAHPLLLLAVPPGRAVAGVGAGLVILLVGHALARRDERAAGTTLGVLACLAPVLALCAVPSLVQLALLPPGLFLGLSALVAVEAAAARASVRVPRGMGAAIAPDGLRGRLAWAALASLVALAGAMGGAVLRARLDGRPDAKPEEELLELPEDRAEQRERAADAPDAPRERFDPDLDLGGGRGAATSDEEVLFVHVAQGAPARPGEVLRLRGRVLDTFTATGLTLTDREPATLRDEDDGRRDGWVRLDPAPVRDPRLLVVQSLVSFALPEDAGELVFLPERARALEARTARHSPDGYCTVPPRPGAGSSHALLYDLAGPSRGDLEAGRLDRGDARFLQLPPRSPGLERMAELARAWVPSRGSDLERVAGLVARLRAELEYDLSGTGFGGPEAMVAFLERGSGYCSYFASAAVLMLRLEGLPARVVTGFAAVERTQDDDAWLVRRRHGHVWIEVPFEGLGWVPFDPTPGRRGRDEGLAEGERAGLDRLLAGASRWLRGVDGLDALVEDLVRTVLGSLRGSPSLVLLGIALVLAAAAALRGRAPGAGEERVLLRVEAAERDLHRRLVAALERLGHRLAPGTTLAGLARGLVDAGGPARPEDANTQALADVLPAARLLDRCAFGGVPLDGAERARLDELVVRLEHLRPGGD